MLIHLSIQNYALLDRMELSFDTGLNIITGETGAGKSILLGALGLLLGQRADTTALLDKSRKCILEASFKADEKKLKEWLAGQDLDWQDPLTLRREISPEGKSRSFINDTPVNLSLLKEAGALLVDIHSQHETLLLNRAGFQLSIVDAYAGSRREAEEYEQRYKTYIARTKEQEEAKLAASQAAAEADYLRFQAEELESAALADGEQEQWEAELSLLSHAEEVKNGLAQASTLVSGGEENLVSRLAGMIQLLQVPARYHAPAESLRERLKSAQIELRDIGDELEHEESGISFSPARMSWLSDRLDLLNRLQQKHRVTSVSELIRAREEFHSRLENIQTLGNVTGELEQECEAMKVALTADAERLSRKRTAAMPGLEKEMKELLKEVALPHARLKVENETGPVLSPSGFDHVRFLFSANKGVDLQEISRVASGGELSRLMLCLKSLLAKLTELPVMIFDEIDSGISGETAVKVGRMLKDMSGRHQVMAITHLPQIAGRGDSHYYVYKETGRKTTTGVRKLSGEERIVEVARMLSGEKPSAVALENARELLQMH